MKRTILDYLNDIVDSMDKAQEFVGGMTYDDFFREDKTQFAVVRALEIIGEASKKIPVPIREKYPQIPWRSITGMRDKVVHEYFGLDLRVIWKTVKEDVPAVKPHFEKLLAAYACELQGDD